MGTIRWTILITLMFTMTSVVGCQRMYYGTMEKLGFQKREILVDQLHCRGVDGPLRCRIQAIERLGHSRGG